jgi:hypothetical protein
MVKHEHGPPTRALGVSDIQIHTHAPIASVILATGGSPSPSTVVTDCVLSSRTPTPAASADGVTAVRPDLENSNSRDAQQPAEGMVV